MTPKRSRRIVWIALTVLAVAGTAILSVKAVGPKTVRIDPDKLVRAERGDLARSVVATGKIQPVTQVEIKSKASGIVQKLPFNVGDFVRKGEVICELDQNDLIPALRQQEAALHVAEAGIRTSQADYDRYKVDAEGRDVSFLKRDRDRALQLFAQGLISQSARDEAERNYEVAAQKQESAKANLASASATIEKMRAAVEQQQASVSIAEENLRNATIVSPVDCVVLSRDVEVGAAVSSILQVGSAATLIMTVGDLNQVYVKGKVDESDIGKVYLGQAARISVESFRDQRFAGRVDRISPMGAEKDNVTTFEVRVSISNEKHLLKSQMTANAEIILEEHKATLTIPEGAVLYNKDKSTAVQIPDAAAALGTRRVAIVTGISNGSKTEVVKGLSDGQEIVLP